MSKIAHELPDDTSKPQDEPLGTSPFVSRSGPSSEIGLAGQPTHSIAAPSAPLACRNPVNSYRALAGLLFGYELLIVGNGFFQTLIPLRIIESGYPTLAVGLIQSCYYCGYILGAVINRRLIDRIGQHRTFVAFSAAASILALAFGTAQSPWVLGFVRLLTGFTFMGLYISIESWLNGTVGNERRGQVFGTYAAINYLAVGTGQFLFNVGTDSRVQQFSIVAALFASAVLPVTLFEGWPAKVADENLEPVPARTWRASMREMMATTPLAVPGCILAGFLYSSFYSMMPVYLQRTGFSTTELATFMGLALIGALVPQWPIGRISDKVDRRRLVYYTSSISGGLSLALFCVNVRAVTWCATLVYVAVTFTLYGLIVSHVHDRTRAHLRIAISATLLVLFSFGGMTGPALASMLMTIFGASGIFLFNALSSLLLAFCARRTLGLTARSLEGQAHP
nr:MFS transporter [Burkholderia ambifaria]